MFDFGENLKQLRKNARLTQEQTARRLGTTKASISSYENNINFPPADVLIQLARLYGISVDSLLGLDEKKQLELHGLTQEQQHTLELLAQHFRKGNLK